MTEQLHAHTIEQRQRLQRQDIAATNLGCVLPPTSSQVLSAINIDGLTENNVFSIQSCNTPYSGEATINATTDVVVLSKFQQ